MSTLHIITQSTSLNIDDDDSFDGTYRVAKHIDLNVEDLDAADDNIDDAQITMMHSISSHDSISKNGHSHPTVTSPGRDAILSPQTSDVRSIIIDATQRRRLRFDSISSRYCRGCHITLVTALSIAELISNFCVILIFLYRAASDGEYIFYIFTAVTVFFIALCSFLSYRIGTTARWYYCFQVGVCFECQQHNNRSGSVDSSGSIGVTAYSFKLLHLMECLSRALPLCLFKLFVLVFFNDLYRYTLPSNWVLALSILCSVVYFAHWFTGHIAATLTERFDAVFDAVAGANTYDGDYSQDPSQSIRRFKMSCTQQTVFCSFIAFDVLTRCGLLFILLKYWTPFIAIHRVAHFVLIPLIFLVVEGVTYFGVMAAVCRAYRQKFKRIYRKSQLVVMILAATVTVAPFYNDVSMMHVHHVPYQRKLLALFVSMLCRLMLSTVFMFFLIFRQYDFSLQLNQLVEFLTFVVLHLVLIIYSTRIIWSCEQLTQTARAKTTLTVDSVQRDN